MKKIIVIGGGIAGLSFALSARKQGLDATVYERSNYHHSGIGLLLLKNGIDAIKKMGVYEDVFALAHPIEKIKMSSLCHRMDVVTPVANMMTIKRKNILSFFRKVLPADVVVMNSEFESFDFSGDQAVAANFVDGQKVAGDCFVAADGISSTVGEEYFQRAAVVSAGVSEIVNIAKSRQLVKKYRNALHKIYDFDQKLAIGIAPISETEVAWFVQFDNACYGLADQYQSDLKAFACQTLDHLCSDMHLAQQTDFQYSFFWDVKKMQQVNQFNRANMVLIGDAAHVFSSETSQGANTALMDAYLLSERLAKNMDDVPQQLHRFSDQRCASLKQCFIDMEKLGSDFFVEGSHLDEPNLPFVTTIDS